MRAMIKGRESEGQFYVHHFTSVAHPITAGGAQHYAVVYHKKTKRIEVVDALLLYDVERG